MILPPGARYFHLYAMDVYLNTLWRYFSLSAHTSLQIRFDHLPSKNGLSAS